MKKVTFTHCWLWLMALPLFSGGCIKAAGGMTPDRGTASLSVTMMALHRISQIQPCLDPGK
ncbi:hypothetical protein [Niabella hirudinis]|uniref:hypothetical protein n=1 Tax=Niabella hirudinis TaxID=1285929 RepID=UPI003EB9E12D